MYVLLTAQSTKEAMCLCNVCVEYYCIYSVNARNVTAFLGFVPGLTASHLFLKESEKLLTLYDSLGNKQIIFKNTFLNSFSFPIEFFPSSKKYVCSLPASKVFGGSWTNSTILFALGHISVCSLGEYQTTPF